MDARRRAHCVQANRRWQRRPSSAARGTAVSGALIHTPLYADRTSHVHDFQGANTSGAKVLPQAYLKIEFAGAVTVYNATQ